MLVGVAATVATDAAEDILDRTEEEALAAEALEANAAELALAPEALLAEPLLAEAPEEDAVAAQEATVGTLMFLVLQRATAKSIVSGRQYGQ